MYSGGAVRIILIGDINANSDFKTFSSISLLMGIMLSKKFLETLPEEHVESLLCSKYFTS